GVKVRGALVPRPCLSYKEALAWLYSLQRFGIKLGLENTQRRLDKCCSGVCAKRPALAAASVSTPCVIHVAGTNGKGSVCAMIDSICRAQGYRTGLFTSPHLITFRERIRVNGEMISENAITNGLTTIRDVDRYSSRREDRRRQLDDCARTCHYRLARSFSELGRAHNNRWRA